MTRAQPNTYQAPGCQGAHVSRALQTDVARRVPIDPWYRPARGHNVKRSFPRRSARSVAHRWGARSLEGMRRLILTLVCLHGVSPIVLHAQDDGFRVQLVLDVPDDVESVVQSFCARELAVREPDRSEDYTMAIKTFDGIVVVEGGLRRPVPGSEGVESFSWNRDGTGFFVTRDGVLGFLPIQGGELQEIYGDWRQVRFPDPSPDGETLAVSVNLTDDTGSGWEMWLLGRNGENPRPVTAGYDPSWSPDGTKLYFEQHEPSVRLAVLDFATGQTTSFLTGPDRDFSVEVSPRGTYAAFSRGRARLMLYTFADSTLVALTDGSY